MYSDACRWINHQHRTNTLHHSQQTLRINHPVSTQPDPTFWMKMWWRCISFWGRRLTACLLVLTVQEFSRVIPLVPWSYSNPSPNRGSQARNMSQDTYAFWQVWEKSNLAAKTVSRSTAAAAGPAGGQCYVPAAAIVIISCNKKLWYS